MSQRPTVTLVHALPGRVRARLSVAPPDPERFAQAVKGHPGLHAVTYTPATRSVLVRYDPPAITPQELLMRMALALSLDFGHVPVVIHGQPESHVIVDSAAGAGILTSVTFLAQLLRRGASNPMLDRLSAAATGGAVLEHAWRETRERGYFDPEVFTLLYLVTAAMRGDFLRGALVTWVIVFGRHLAGEPAAGVEVRPVRGARPGDEPNQYEVVIIPSPSRQAPLFRVLQSLAGVVTSGAAPGQAGLLEEMRHVANAHGEMVEGLGWMREGVPIRFEQT
jgi:hypothetical protein